MVAPAWNHNQISPRWWWALLAGLTVWTMASTAAADTLCDEGEEEASLQEAEVDLKSLPCGGDRPSSVFQSFESPRYNACFMANRLPATSAPAWLAQHVGDEMSMGTVFEQVRHLTVSGGDSPASSPPPAWIAEQLQQWQARADEQRRPNAACVESDHREACGALPSPAVLVMAGTFAPATRAETELQIPWRPGTSWGTTEIATILPVGPAEGHPRGVDRPPELS